MGNLNIKYGLNDITYGQGAYIPTGALIMSTYKDATWTSLYDTDAKCIAAGRIPCDGRALNASTYSEYLNLYTVIKNIYGGTTNADFKIPDLRTVRRYLAGTSGTGVNPSFSANTSNAIAHSHTTTPAFSLSSTLASGTVTHTHNIITNATTGTSGGGSHTVNVNWGGGVGNPPGTLSKVDGNSSGSGAAHVHNTSVNANVGTNAAANEAHNHGAGSGSGTSTVHSHTHAGNVTVTSANTTGSELPQIDVVYFIKI